jgi:hypothetical protein
MVDSSQCGKVVDGGAMHRAVMGSLEGAGVTLRGGSMMVEMVTQWG